MREVWSPAPYWKDDVFWEGYEENNPELLVIL